MKGKVINTYHHPALAWMFDHSTATIMLCSVVLLLGAAALLTRWWGEKDEAARLTTYRPVDRSRASNLTSTWR